MLQAGVFPDEFDELLFAVIPKRVLHLSRRVSRVRLEEHDLRMKSLK